MEEILIVDDEATVRKSFAALFVSEGYAVRTARDGVDALAKFSERRPDLVLLDVMMPKKNGIAACEEIRKADPLVPILFFTAMPSDVSLVRGLGLGADDYIDKARSPEEFVARVKSALRRAKTMAVADDIRTVTSRGVEINFDTFVVSGKGIRTRLTKGEADFLWLLNSTPGKVFSYDEIFDVLRGRDYVGDTHALQIMVNKMRNKLGPAGDCIVNERGLGYAFKQDR